MISTGLLFAQGNEQIQNKKGNNILPEKGEFAIGVNAIPFLVYIGDLFGSNDNNTALEGNKFLPNNFGANSIYGKYMWTENRAFRANLGFNTQSSKFSYNVIDQSVSSPGIDSLANDYKNTNNNQFNLGLGIEFRRGKSRIRAHYGGELIFMTQKKQTEYEYANTFNTLNQNPISTFNANGFQMGVNGNPVSQRLISNTGTRTYGAGLRAFIGLEYFVAPKFCIGTEFGYSAIYTKTSSTKQVTEYYSPIQVNDDGTIGGAAQLKVEQNGSTHFNTSTDNFGGALYLMFYF